MKITVAFRCPEGCDKKISNYDSLDDLMRCFAASGWPICCECGVDTIHEIVSSDETMEGISVQGLIDELNKVKDKQQAVVGCIRGVEVGESLIVGVSSRETYEDSDQDDIGLCWLLFRENSSIHED